MDLQEKPAKRITDIDQRTDRSTLVATCGAFQTSCSAVSLMCLPYNGYKTISLLFCKPGKPPSSVKQKKAGKAKRHNNPLNEIWSMLSPGRNFLSTDTDASASEKLKP
ncbi:hypothetical protein RRG08_004954 [Elysia crispata]|uniref:Uncharacterized protein n=1 Tax=Elysia crispata TaxID=231223 RepID=A0AAE0ZI85_9GAST|nr:hypothetical protein RRG08_004954 [Elysia crispata]